MSRSPDTAAPPARPRGPPAPRAGRHRADGPGPDDLIIGIAAAARFLGYGKPESFRRARTRHPIPGEHKTPDGRPCWTAPRPARLAQRTENRREPGRGTITMRPARGR